MKEGTDPIEMDEDIFAKVVFNSRTANPCSPQEPDPEFLGILINAPKSVSFKAGERVGMDDAFAAIPVCGFYMLEMQYQRKYHDVVEAMRLVAVEKETGWEFSGSVMRPRPTIPNTKRPHVSDEQIRNMATGGYFNPNLAERVALPAVPGEYDVFVELGERDSEDFIKSNVVHITISESL